MRRRQFVDIVVDVVDASTAIVHLGCVYEQTVLLERHQRLWQIPEKKHDRSLSLRSAQLAALQCFLGCLRTEAAHLSWKDSMLSNVFTVTQKKAS